VPSGTRVEGLGTDLLARNVARAERAEYGAWSYRQSTGLYGMARPPKDETTRVDLGVRSVVRFAVHNLLDPPLLGEEAVDIVLCRNVLLYFGPDAAVQASARMASSLAKGGIALFGPLDVSGPPHGLQRIGRAELNAFERPTTVVPPRRTTRPPLSSVPLARGRSAPPRLVDAHLHALALTEQGEWHAAEDVLADLYRTTPDYLPGLFEYAVLFIRSGRLRRAGALMKELLTRLTPLRSDLVLAGPEELPAEYYRVAARAFLDAQGQTTEAK
jgi:hypothetical protein